MVLVVGKRSAFDTFASWLPLLPVTKNVEELAGAIVPLKQRKHFGFDRKLAFPMIF
jgi:hypothetical protein